MCQNAISCKSFTDNQHEIYVILCDSFAILPFTLPEEMMTDFGVYLVFERGSCNCAVVVVVGVANIHFHPTAAASSSS
jgi:hypothetical protein